MDISDIQKIGTRGKSAEASVASVFKLLEHRQDFAWFRMPDARAGSMKATLADFLVQTDTGPWLVEVKEVSHDFRLPHKNFTVDKVARMRMFEMAGMKGLVLIRHSTTGLWRGVDLRFFYGREGGSWDLSEFEPSPDLRWLPAVLLKARA
jgi:hypothetical protein